jgi:hypothetical protein
MMEAVSTSETSANSYQTTPQNIPKDSRLHTCRRENTTLRASLTLFAQRVLSRSSQTDRSGFQVEGAGFAGLPLQQRRPV